MYSVSEMIRRVKPGEGIRSDNDWGEASILYKVASKKPSEQVKQKCERSGEAISISRKEQMQRWRQGCK